MDEKGTDETAGKDAAGPGGHGGEVGKMLENEHHRQRLALRGTTDTSKYDKEDPVLFAALKHVASNPEQARKLNADWIKRSKYAGKHLGQSIER